MNEIDPGRGQRFVRAGKSCTVPGCTTAARTFGRFCHTHAQRNRRYGHPEGNAVPLHLINTSRELAKAYLGMAHDSERLRAGVEWCGKWLLRGEPQGDKWHGLSPEQTVSAFMHRNERLDVTGAEVLATLAALAYIRKFCPGHIKSDSHYRFSVVRAVFQLRGWPVIGMRAVAGSGQSQSVQFAHPTPRVIQAAFRQIPPAVLVLAEDIAARVREYEERQVVEGEYLFPADSTPIPAFI